MIGVALGLQPEFVLFPVLVRSLLLVLLALGFRRSVAGVQPYPHHWL